MPEVGGCQQSCGAAGAAQTDICPRLPCSSPGDCPRVSSVLLSAAGVVSGWEGKKFSSAFLKLKCKMVLIWAFYRLGNVFSLSGFILEQFTWYISWSCIAGVACRYLMLHKLLWNKKTLFPTLMFYIQFAIKQKTCKLNSCFPHKLEEIWK